MENLVMEAIKNRSSVRGYTEEKLTKEEQDALICAALSAPSAMNRQPCRVVLVNNTELLREIEDATISFFSSNKEVSERLASRKNKIFYDASTVIFISIPEKEKNGTIIDAGIMVENIAIAAKGLGLDSVIIGLSGVAFDGENSDYFKKKLNFEEGHTFAISIAIGHAQKPASPHTIDYSKAIVI